MKIWSFKKPLVALKPWQTLQNAAVPENDIRISNAISVARILAMFWIFSVNYFPFIFKNYYGVDYAWAVESGANFVSTMAKNATFVDKAAYVFAYAGWAGVIVFSFLIGFSLWFSIMKSKKFSVKNYFLRRFNSIYVSYFCAAMVAFAAGILSGHVKPAAYHLAALIAGAARYSNAYEYNPPLWFISLLVVNYLFFPILPAVYRRFKFWGILAVLGVSFGLFFGFGEQYFLVRKGVSYPLMPFWAFVCLGVAAAYLAHKYGRAACGHLRSPKVAAVFAAVIASGSFIIYELIYGIPANNLNNAWSVGDIFAAGTVATLIFMAAGYLMPLRFQPTLRWLSRGTLAVFLYHYVILYLAAPFIRPELLSSHLSIALVATFSALLLFFSFFQDAFDRTVGAYVKRATRQEYEITN